MRVDPHVAVGAGADVAGDLVALHRQLHQHPLPLHPVGLGQAVVPRRVGLHLTVAGGHHAGMGQAAGARQLQVDNGYFEGVAGGQWEAFNGD